MGELLEKERQEKKQGEGHKIENFTRISTDFGGILVIPIEP